MPLEFWPRRVYVEPGAMDYPLGRRLHDYFTEKGVPVTFTTTHNRVTGLPGDTPAEAYREAKNTLVVGVRKTLDFQPCRPSADFQLPLVTSCPGLCEYCYLQTTLGKRPYVRVYVNVDEVLTRAAAYIRERQPEITSFEAAAVSDPLPVEPFTGALGRAVSFFALQELGRLRFVTKYTGVNSLLDIEHRGHTRIRFSVNSQAVIEKHEARTPPPGSTDRGRGASGGGGLPFWIRSGSPFPRG